MYAIQTWWSRILDRLEQRPLVQRILKNVGWLLIDRALGMIIGLVVTALVARYLGPAKLGILNYAISFAGLFLALVQLGLPNIIVRDLVRNPSSENEVLGTGFFLQLLGGVVSVALASLAIWIVRPDDALTRALVLILSLGQLSRPLQVVGYWFEARIESRYAVWATKFGLLAASALRIALILSEQPLTAFALAYVSEWLLAGVFMVWFYVRQGQSPLRWRFDRSRSSQLLRDSWPLILAGIAVAIYMRFDTIMLREISGEEAAGIYAAAIRLSELWYVIPMALASSAFPAIVDLRSKDKAVYDRRMSLFYGLMAGLGYVVAIPMSLLSGIIVRIIYGAQYAASAPVLAIHIWALLFVSLGTARSKWLVAENLTRYAMITTVIGAMVNIGLNYALIPRWGTQGAAWATLLSQATTSLLLCAVFKPLRPAFRQMSATLLLPLRPEGWRAMIRASRE